MMDISIYIVKKAYSIIKILKFNSFKSPLIMINSIKKISFFYSTMLFLITVLFISCETEIIGADINSKPEYLINFEPAIIDTELITLKSNPDFNLIRTPEDFNDLVNNYQTPFNYLTKKDIKEFEENLVFRKDAGVVGLKFKSIKSKLSEKDFVLIMSYFGIDMLQGFWPGSLNKAYEMIDYKGAECMGNGNCIINAHAICTSNC